MKPNPPIPPLRVSFATREARRRAGRRSRRRGQALLLAVLLMVFAALLGATMITLVSSNLNQTTRQGGVSGARASSSAAIAFVNDRLTNSLEGDLWRPWLDNQPPVRGSADFNLYYTPFEQAQGWVNEVDFVPAPGDDPDGNGVNYGDGDARSQFLDRIAFVDQQFSPPLNRKCYVKFPDPRGPAKNANGPQYLVQVAPIASPTGRRLSIRVIGTNEDEPGAFDVRTASKPTSENQGPFSYARFDSNYNYGRKSITRTKLSAPVTSTTAPTTLVVDSTDGFEMGRTVVIGDDPATAQAAVIMSVNPAGPTIQVNAIVSAALGVPVTAASTLMDGIPSGTFDADGDGTLTNTWETTEAPVRYSNTAPNGSRKMKLNGGAILEGRSNITLDTADTIEVAGVIPAINAAASTVTLLRNQADGTTASISSGNNGRTGLQTRVRDNRGAPSTHVQPLTPPSVDGAESRYREMTQFGQDASGSVAAGASYGYGPGVYINNGSDIDRFATPQQLSIMESHQMYSNRAPFAYSAPAAGTLEQRRIRGWVSPWEFMPRGTQVELAGDKIIFTRDDRSDALSTDPLFSTPDPDKAWRSTNGAPLAAPLTSTYRMVLDVNTGRRTVGVPGSEVEIVAAGALPFNGVILLEGNARVRGFLQKTVAGVTTRGRDVTLVSMGTIFVEGSVVRDASSAATIADPAANAPRIALLAKRDVVLNLSQSVARVPGSQDVDVTTPPVTLTNSPGAGDNFEIDATEATRFRVGDIVRAATDREWHQVTGINGTVLTLLPALQDNAARIAGVRVIRLSDPALQVKDATELPGPTAALRTVYEMDPAQEQAFARDVRRDGIDLIDGAGNTVTYQMAWLHGGQRVAAAQVRREHGGRGTFNIKENTLPGGTPDTLISGAADAANEKLLKLSPGVRVPPPTDIDLLNVDNNAARDGDTVETLNALRNNANVTDIAGPPADPSDWKITPDARFLTAPARRLAGVGTAPGAGDDAQVEEGAVYSVPLALGGRWDFQINWLAGARSLVPPTTDPALRVIGASVDPVESDDLETSDQDFYQLAPGTTTQAPTRWSAGAPVAFAPGAVGHNVLAFTNDTTFRVPDLPKYWISALKVEADNFAQTPHVFQAVPIHVQATIFAQQGSWCVATPAMHDVDDDRDGVANQPNDISAATRYRRWNYRVFVKGSIVQNFTPSGLVDFIPDPVTPTTINQVPGSMLGWLDTLSYPTQIANGGGATPKGRGENWQTIEYQPDPVPFYNGLHLPPTPDLLYTS